MVVDLEREVQKVYIVLADESDKDIMIKLAEEQIRDLQGNYTDKGKALGYIGNVAYDFPIERLMHYRSNGVAAVYNGLVPYREIEIHGSRNPAYRTILNRWNKEIMSKPKR